MTETISKDTVLFKVQLKNMVNAAIKEITDPKNRDFNKKVLAATLLLIFITMGTVISINAFVLGLQTLKDSGVSEILINRTLGVSLCILGIAALRETYIVSVRVGRRAFFGKADKEKT